MLAILNRNTAVTSTQNVIATPGESPHRVAKKACLEVLSKSLEKAQTPKELEHLRGQLLLALTGQRECDPYAGDNPEIFPIFKNVTESLWHRSCTESGTLALAGYALRIFGNKILGPDNHIDQEQLQLAMHMLFGNHMRVIEGDLAKLECRANGDGTYHLSTKNYAMNLSSLKSQTGQTIDFNQFVKPQTVNKEFFYDKSRSALEYFFRRQGGDAIPDAFDFCIDKIAKANSKSSVPKEPSMDRYAGMCMNMEKDSVIYTNTITTILPAGKQLVHKVVSGYFADSAPSELSKKVKRNQLEDSQKSSTKERPSKSAKEPVIPAAPSLKVPREVVPASGYGSSQDSGEGISNDDIGSGPLVQSDAFSLGQSDIGATVKDSLTPAKAKLLPNNAHCAQSKVTLDDDFGRPQTLVDRTTYLIGSQYGGTEDENAERAHTVLSQLVKEAATKYPTATSFHIYESRLLGNVPFHTERDIFNQNQKAFNSAVETFNAESTLKQVKYTSVHVEAHNPDFDKAKTVLKTVAGIIPVVGPEEMEHAFTEFHDEFGDIVQMRTDFNDTFFARMTDKNKAKFTVVLNKWNELSKNLRDPSSAIPFIALTSMLVDAFNADQNLDRDGVKVIDPFGCKSAKDRTTCVYLAAIMMLRPLFELEMLKPKPNLNRFFLNDGTFNFEGLSPAEKVMVNNHFDLDYTHRLGEFNSLTSTNLNSGSIQSFFQHVEFIKNAKYFIVKAGD